MEELQLKVTKYKQKDPNEWSRLLTPEHSENWIHVYGWVCKFNSFIQEAVAKIPENKNKLHEAILDCEKEVLAQVKERLFELPKMVSCVLKSVEARKKAELECLRQTEVKITDMLQTEKKAFKMEMVTFSEATIEKMTEPLKIDIDKVVGQLEELHKLQAKSEELLVFDQVNKMKTEEILVQVQKMGMIKESEFEDIEIEFAVEMKASV